MNAILKFILSTKLIFVLIYVFLIQYFYVPSLFSKYMFSDETLYIYQYSKHISKGLVYVGFLLSFLYPLLIWRKSKEYFKEHLVLVFIGFFPALYYTILFSLSLFFKSYNY